MVSYEIHGFCDASEMSYAGVIYLKTLDILGNVNIEIIAAKTKLAPLKRVSLPRLELCGALLMAKLFQRVKNNLILLNIQPQYYAWTDSTIVLDWLNGNSYKWKTFVANRVSKIQSLLAPSC